MSYKKPHPFVSLMVLITLSTPSAAVHAAGYEAKPVSRADAETALHRHGRSILKLIAAGVIACGDSGCAIESSPQTAQTNPDGSFKTPNPGYHLESRTSGPYDAPRTVVAENQLPLRLREGGKGRPLNGVGVLGGGR
jgi:hypothetical protein